MRTHFTAAVMAGALAFAAVPQADALTVEQFKAFAENPPQAFVDEAGNYFKLIGGEYVKAELPATAQEAASLPTVSLDADGNPVLAPGVNAYPENPKEPTIEGLVAAREQEKKDAAAQQQADANAAAALPALNAKCGETVWYRTADGTHYVTDQAKVEGALPQDRAQVKSSAEMQEDVEKQDCAYVEGMEVATPNLVEVPKAEGLTPGAIAGIAAAAAAPLVIGGVAYWLNKDGSTLVADRARVEQEPTAEERAESDRLRIEHAAEIAAQESRGIAAETGSNALARTLFALVLASLLGAGAFVAGRRFLV